MVAERFFYSRAMALAKERGPGYTHTCLIRLPVYRTDQHVGVAASPEARRETRKPDGRRVGQVYWFLGKRNSIQESLQVVKLVGFGYVRTGVYAFTCGTFTRTEQALPASLTHCWVQ